MRDAFTATDKEQPLFDVQTMEARAQASLGQRRLTALLLMLFAMFAVLLAAVGVYGVFSYSVAQRAHEIAIRLALGSARTRVLRHVVAEANWLLAAGGVIGLAGAFFLSKLLRSMPVGVTSHDAVSLCAGLAGDDGRGHNRELCSGRQGVSHRSQHAPSYRMMH